MNLIFISVYCFIVKFPFPLYFPLNVLLHIILVCLCLSAGLHRNYPKNVLKLGVGVGNGPKEEPINFGANPDNGVDPGFFFLKSVFTIVK